jgi:ketosteroid isomerase-like protein
MKKLPFTGSIFLFLLLVSCKDSARDGTSTTSIASSPSSEKDSVVMKNSEHSRAVYRGIESGDMSAMDDFVATDVVDHNAGPGRELHSLDSVKKMLGDIHNHFTDLKVDVVAEGTSSDGDYHFALVKMKGKAKDAAMGMQPGQPFEETAVDVVRMENGKIKEHWRFMDANEMMNMMAGKNNKMKK